MECLLMAVAEEDASAGVDPKEAVADGGYGALGQALFTINNSCNER